MADRALKIVHVGPLIEAVHMKHLHQHNLAYPQGFCVAGASSVGARSTHNPSGLVGQGYTVLCCPKVAREGLKVNGLWLKIGSCALAGRGLTSPLARLGARGQKTLPGRSCTDDRRMPAVHPEACQSSQSRSYIDPVHSRRRRATTTSDGKTHTRDTNREGQ